MEAIGIKKKQGSVVEILRDEILTGNIPSGMEMTQNELATSLGVSRMPVREALILLEYQGLIERLPNNHVRVSEFSQAYFSHIFRHCAELEAEALENWQSPGELPAAELAFHRAIWQSYPYSLSKKTLETLVEIYIAFIVNNNMDSDTRTACIKEMIETWKSGNKEQGKVLLYQYFEMLVKTIVQIRE